MKFLAVLTLLSSVYTNSAVADERSEILSKLLRFSGDYMITECDSLLGKVGESVKVKIIDNSGSNGKADIVLEFKSLDRWNVYLDKNMYFKKLGGQRALTLDRGNDWGCEAGMDKTELTQDEIKYKSRSRFYLGCAIPRGEINKVEVSYKKIESHLLIQYRAGKTIRYCTLEHN